MLQEKTPAPRQLADVVAERIEQLIVDGVLKPGQALPSERRLCEKLGSGKVCGYCAAKGSSTPSTDAARRFPN